MTGYQLAGPAAVANTGFVWVFLEELVCVTEGSCPLRSDPCRPGQGPSQRCLEGDLCLP